MPEIDLLQYLRKVGLTKRGLKDFNSLEKLTQIYRAHLRTFSYNNVVLRREGLRHPLVRNIAFEAYKNPSFRSGYCFQLACLLKDVLDQLGFQVDVCEARVLMGAEVNSPSIMVFAPQHLVLTVTIDGLRYFLDPGMGSNAPRLPVLVPTATVATVIEQPLERLSFSYRENEKLYLLEKILSTGTLSLIQTDLIAIKKEAMQQRIKNLLTGLEHSPGYIPI